MSEDDTRKARQKKRTSQSKRFVAPDNVPEGQPWIGAPPKAKLDQGKGPSSPPAAKAQPPRANPYLNKSAAPQQNPSNPMVPNPNIQGGIVGPQAGFPQQQQRPVNPAAQNPYVQGATQQGPQTGFPMQQQMAANPAAQNPYVQGAPQQGPQTGFPQRQQMPANPAAQNPYVQGAPQQGPQTGFPQQQQMPANPAAQNPYVQGAPQQGPQTGFPQQQQMPANPAAQNPYVQGGPQQGSQQQGPQSGFPMQQQQMPANPAAQNPYVQGAPQQGPQTGFPMQQPQANPAAQNPYVQGAPQQAPQAGFPLQQQQMPANPAAQNPYVQRAPQQGLQSVSPQHVPPNTTAQNQSQPTADPFDLNLTPVTKPPGVIKRTDSVRKGAAPAAPVSRKPRRVTKNWYWPEEDEDACGQKLYPAPVFSKPLSAPLGLLRDDGEEEGDSKKSAFAQAIDDYDYSRSQVKDESKAFAQVIDEILNQAIETDVDARACIDKLARSCSAKTVTRELTELAPRIASLVKANKELLSDLIELCRAVERQWLSVDGLTKVFEQLNRLYDAPVLGSRRQLVVEHYLRVVGRGLAIKKIEQEPLGQMELCETLLLSRYPDRAAEFLLSVMTSSRINNDELAIRPFKFDRDKARTVVKVSRDALEPEPAMRQSESVFQSNYFSFLLKTVALNAVLQDSMPTSRYIRRKGKDLIYSVSEQEVKPGVFRVTPSATQEFSGLTLEQMAWVNRQFAGVKPRHSLPDKVKMFD